MSLPRIQVAITSTTPAPMASGTQPPDSSFRELADRKATSTARSGAIKSAVRHTLHFHSRRTTMAARAVVTAMVPVTARP